MYKRQVISSHGRSGLSEWNTGAVAHKVIERSGVSILLVRAQKAAEITPSGMLDAARYRRILVPIDGSLRSKAVLHLATRLAKVHDAELLLAHGIMTVSYTHLDVYKRQSPGDSRSPLRQPG